MSKQIFLTGLAAGAALMGAGYLGRRNLARTQRLSGIIPIVTPYIDIETAEGVLAVMERLPEERVTIVLHTLGGCVTACVLIANALRQFRDSTAIVPYMAISGGTLIALSATRLEMGGRASLSAVDHLLQLRGHRPAFTGLLHLVDQQAHRPRRLGGGQHLHRGVGIGQRRGLGRGHDQHLVGQRDGEQHHVGDARAGVEQHLVEARAHLGDDVEQLVAYFGRHARVLHQARSGQQHREATGRRLHRFVERGTAGEHVVQRDPGGQVQHHVEVGQAQVGIEHQHALAGTGQRGGQVGGHEGLADAALAAGDRRDARAVRAEGTAGPGSGGCWIAHSGS